MDLSDRDRAAHQSHLVKTNAFISPAPTVSRIRALELRLGRKFVKRVKRQVPWVEHVIDDVAAARDLNYDPEQVRVSVAQGSLCLACRGGRALCGRPRCPALLRLRS